MTLNQLLTKIEEADSKTKQKRILSRDFSKYTKNKKLRKRDQEAFEKYTFNTMYDRIYNSIERGFDKASLKRTLNNTINLSKKFQNQRVVLERENKKIEASDDDTTYIYVLTHPTKTGIHDPSCLNRLANNPYTKEEALEAMKDLPAHVNCTCNFTEEK